MNHYDELLRAAVDAAAHGNRTAVHQAVRHVRAAKEHPQSRRLRELDAALERTARWVFDAIADHGWTAMDAARIVERREGALAADTLRALHERGHAIDDEPWLVAVGRTHGGADVLLLACLFALGEATRLPAVPPHHQADGELDDDVLRKVRALLAKAESTTFEEEAAAFTAKAQELMARYAIDEASVAAATGHDFGAVVSRRVWLDPPYASAKGGLLSAVASANRCRAVGMSDADVVVLFGRSADLQATELLYSSLLVQATTVILGAGSRVDQRGRSRTRSFRQSFLVAFAVTVGDRLREAHASAAAESGPADASALPVLVAHEERLDEAMREAFPQLRRVRSRMSNSQGVNAGIAAGQRADLGGKRLQTS